MGQAAITQRTERSKWRLWKVTTVLLDIYWRAVLFSSALFHRSINTGSVMLSQCMRKLLELQNSWYGALKSQKYSFSFFLQNCTGYSEISTYCMWYWRKKAATWWVRCEWTNILSHLLVDLSFLYSSRYWGRSLVRNSSSSAIKLFPEKETTRHKFHKILRDKTSSSFFVFMFAYPRSLLIFVQDCSGCIEY